MDVHYRVLRYFIVLAHRFVDGSNAQKRNQDHTVKDCGDEDSFITVHLTLSVFLLSMGLRDKCTDCTIECGADRQRADADSQRA